MKTKFALVFAVAVAAAAVSAEDAYVQLSGTQAINTGYKTTRTTLVKLDFQLTETPAAGTRIIGGDASGNAAKLSLMVNGSGKFAYVSDEASPSSGKDAATSRYTVSMPAAGNAKIYNANGSAYSGENWIRTKDATMTYPLVIGANANNSSATSISNLVAKMKVYGFQVYEKVDGAYSLKYDYKPALKGGSACLYDAATGMMLKDDRGKALDYGGDIEILPEDGYVQSNGSALQGINSRFFWQPGARLDIDYELTDATVNSQLRLAGADWSGAKQRMAIYVGGGGISFGLGDDVKFSGNGTIAPDKVRHTAILDSKNNKYYLKTGVTLYGSGTLSGVCTNVAVHPIGLMGSCTNQNGSVYRYPAKMKLYGAKFYLNGTLVHNYVPCVKGDVAGLKDLVDGAFVTSGALTYGGNILKEKDDPYLENTDGINYIDTGYKPTGKTKIVADFAFRQNTAQQFVFEGTDGNGVAFREYINGSGNLAYRCSDGNNSSGVYVATGSPAVPARPYERHQFTIDAVANEVIVANAGYTNWLAKNWITITNTKTNQYSIKLFSSSDGKTNHADMRLYGLKFYEDGVLKKNFVPYIKDGRRGLQDLVNSTFVTGKSNVAMRVYGDAACNKIEDAYLESDGKQLINSGYFANYKSRIAIDYAFLDTTAAAYQSRLFGQDANVDVATMAFKTAWYINGSGKLAVGGGDNGAFNGTTFKLTSDNKTECAADLTRYSGILNFNNGTPSVALRTPDGKTTYAKASMSSSATYSKTSEMAMGIFGTATNNAFTGWRNLAKVKIYSVDIREDGEVLHKYYPAKINGKVGLYDLNGEQLHCNVTGSETDFTIGGAGYDGKGVSDGFVIKPESEYCIKYGKAVTIKAFAPGAVEYKWTKNGAPIEVEGISLFLDWKRQRTKDVYSITPVYNVNGLTVEGSPTTTEVTYNPCGLSIVVR